jgi:O-6-methylguanine DNA methyltransferase
MLAISDEKVLYVLQFVECSDVDREIERLSMRTASTIIPGTREPILSIANELKAYFDGSLKTFKTPISFLGTPFQQSVWRSLMAIPYGQTRSYAAQAHAIKRPSAFRAVANANGANNIAIVIPCHRVINGDGRLGGYAAGIIRKEWLIDHEKKMCDKANSL